MMYCANRTCPMDRVFDGASHAFCCPACGTPLMLTDQQLLRGGSIFLFLAAFGGLITWMVLADSSWGEIVRLDSPITAVVLTVSSLFCAFGLVFGTTQLLVYLRSRRAEIAAAAVESEEEGENPAAP